MSRSSSEEKEGRTGIAAVVEIVVIVAVALGLALVIQAFLVKPYKIPSGSMIPTLVEGQRVLVNRLSHRFGEPEVGDVTVFHPPLGAGSVDGSERCGDPNQRDDQPCGKPVSERSDEYFIKRIVAGPGDTVFVRNGHAFVNGKRQADGFTTPCGAGAGCNLEEPIRVPAGHWFMMGDNRGASDDSRFWGPVPTDWIIGPAFATYWPVDRIGGV
ncbi:MAG: signal peptidase I [Baekduia sp.]